MTDMRESNQRLRAFLEQRLKESEYEPKHENWCKRCSRYHKTTKPCDHYLRTRTAKSGAEVKRWAA